MTRGLFVVNIRKQVKIIILQKNNIFNIETNTEVKRRKHAEKREILCRFFVFTSPIANQSQI